MLRSSNSIQFQLISIKNISISLEPHFFLLNIDQIIHNRNCNSSSFFPVQINFLARSRSFKKFCMPVQETRKLAFQIMPFLRIFFSFNISI